MSFSKQEAMATSVLKLAGVIVPILKVTRAGATTSLIKKAVEANKKVVIVEPTHRIGESTVAEAVSHSNIKNAKILQLFCGGNILELAYNVNTFFQLLRSFRIPADSFVLR